jgi:hypothetical protein
MKTSLLILTVGTFLLAACSSQQSAPTAEVTIEVSATSERSETPFRRPTLPPTWTPTPELTLEVTEETEGTPDVLATRQSEQYSGTTAAVDGGGECTEFGPDTSQSDSTVTAGQSIDVYWMEAGGSVFYYEAILADSLSNRIDTERTTPQITHASLSGSQLEPGQVYYWSVKAYDASAEVICESRLVEIRVES